MGEDSEPREDAEPAAPDGGTASDGDGPESAEPDAEGYEDAEAAAAAAVERLDAAGDETSDAGEEETALATDEAGETAEEEAVATDEAGKTAEADSPETEFEDAEAAAAAAVASDEAAEAVGADSPETEFEDAEAAAAAAVERLEREGSAFDEEDGSELDEETSDDPDDEEDDTSDPYIVDEEDGVGGISGPDYDQEMPLADHIEEMVKRLAIVIVIAGSLSIFILPFAVDIITFLWYSYLPSGEPPRLYGPLELLLARLKVASLGGLLVALPVAVYQTYRFMRPGLYPNERKYYLASVPISLVLGILGVLFAYFVILPAIFTYFYTYSQDAGEIAFALAETFDLMLILMAYLAIIFQIPLFIMLAIMMGLTTRQWLQDKRLYFWAAFLGLAFISNPDPTGMAPFLITTTMIGLYEGTLLILKWVGR